ncbi:MAG: uracil-DNA glycosylase family protein [Euryarchaeota archaeon]|nr:uracil-DNA glycosylase family protein [Euryarchaeota archaeon]
MTDPIALISEEASACRACPLGHHRARVVIYDGTEQHPEVLFVGQSPGGSEDRSGRPFTGASGSLLRGAIETNGLKSYGFINLVNCYVQPGHWDDRYAAACTPFLDRKLQLYQPTRLFVTVGRDAQRFIGLRTGSYERVETLAGLRVVHLVHPSAVLRRGGDPNDREWLRDWSFIRKELSR